ncbi:MAG: hypothetical protein GMKNLPBB_01811 [Myxococcota bacterium]|nr:hypothetical protein [Myxococcota bacterium]
MFMKESPVFIKSYARMLWLTGRMEKCSKNQHFLMARRMEETVLGCTGLGICYQGGPCGLEKDLERARVYYDKACNGGEINACNYLKNLGQ